MFHGKLLFHRTGIFCQTVPLGKLLSSFPLENVCLLDSKHSAGMWPSCLSLWKPSVRSLPASLPCLRGSLVAKLQVIGFLQGLPAQWVAKLPGTAYFPASQLPCSTGYLGARLLASLCISRLHRSSYGPQLATFPAVVA